MHVRTFAEGNREQERRPPEPAPLPLHAVLALQRAAGNQAVGRVLARQTFKDREIRSDVKGAVAAGHKTRDAILLAIYNEMRLTLREDEKPFSRVSVAVEKLIAGNKMDAEDAEKFAAEAEKQLKGGGATVSPAEQLRTEIAEDRGAIMTAMGEHVLRGGWSTANRPAGFHTTQGRSRTHEAFGAVTAAANNTYQQSVREIADTRNVKPTQSTFFPDTASADDVIDAITSVYGKRGKAKGRKSVAYPEALQGIPLTQREGTAFPNTAEPVPGVGYDNDYKPPKH
jgi:hypothetical protein